MGISRELLSGIVTGVVIGSGFFAWNQLGRISNERKIIQAERDYLNEEFGKAYKTANKVINEGYFAKRSTKQKAKILIKNIEDKFSETILNEVEENINKNPKKYEVNLSSGDVYFQSVFEDLQDFSPTYKKYFT